MTVNMQEEEEQLEGVETELEKEAQRLFQNLQGHSDDYRELARYMWEHQTDFDEYELTFNRLHLDQVVDSGEKAKAQLYRIIKMQDSPYFARIDFRQEGETVPMKVYIGRFSFWNLKSPYEIFDWRAPIAGMYYEFEYGAAQYEAPAGAIAGTISCKRQYGIRRGKLEYALESSVSISDEILQQELAAPSGDRMKDIVTTIQKEQNRLIRNEAAEMLIIQGVAGSGKTSVALHRIAYFLYRYKNEISADDFLIISPNGIFVDYISEVLPELGEEPVRSVSMEEIAEQYFVKKLSGRFRVERMSHPTERFLTTADAAWLERNRFKSTAAFVGLLEEFLRECDRTHFDAKDYRFDGGSIPETEIRKYYDRLGALPLHPRLREMAGRIAEDIRAQGKRANKQDILEWLLESCHHRDAMELYAEFYEWLGREELYIRDPEQEMEAADVFPLLYVSLFLAGRPENGNIRYLVVDEMQDYSPVQYAVLDRLYPCRKTFLGDFSQKVIPFSEEGTAYLRQLYPEAEIESLYKSYRSSYEIMEFARQFAGDIRLEAVKRHGEVPEVIACADGVEESARLLAALRESLAEEKESRVGIICKTQVQAEDLYIRLKQELKDGEKLCLLTYDSKEFSAGVTVGAVALCKGLEFDRVLIPDVDDENYSSEYEKGLLYVACTRAMHRLTLLYTGVKSRLLTR